MSRPPRDLDALLAGGGETPDLTRPIMARLGYMRVPTGIAERVARRRRRRRLVARLAMVAAAASIVAIGLHVHRTGPTARRPSGPTIHSALGRDVDRTQQHLDRTIQTIQGFRTFLAPEGLSVDPAGPADPGAIETAPTRRRLGPAGVPGLLRPRTTEPRPDRPRLDRPELFDVDVELSGIGPMRWL